MGKLFEDLNYAGYVPKYAGLNNDKIEQVTNELQVDYDQNLNDANRLQTELKKLNVRSHNAPIVNAAYNQTLQDFETIKQTGRWQDAKYQVDNTTRKNFLDNTLLQGALMDKQSADAYAKDLSERTKLDSDKGGVSQEQADLALAVSHKVNNKSVELDENGKPKNIFSGVPVAPYIDIPKMSDEATKGFFADTYGTSEYFKTKDGNYYVMRDGKQEVVRGADVKRYVNDYLKSNGKAQSYLDNIAELRTLNKPKVTQQEILNEYIKGTSINDEDKQVLGIDPIHELTPKEEQQIIEAHQSYFYNKAKNLLIENHDYASNMNPNMTPDEVNREIYKGIEKSKMMNEAENAMANKYGYQKNEAKYDLEYDQALHQARELAHKRRESEDKKKVEDYTITVMGIPNNGTGNLPSTASLPQFFNKNAKGQFETDVNNSILRFGDQYSTLNNLDPEELKKLKVVATVSKEMNNIRDLNKNKAEIVKTLKGMPSSVLNTDKRVIDLANTLKKNAISWDDFEDLKGRAIGLNDKQLNAIGDYAIAMEKVGTQPVESFQESNNIKKVQGNIYLGVNTKESAANLEKAGLDETTIEELNKLTNNAFQEEVEVDSKGKPHKVYSIKTNIKHTPSLPALQKYSGDKEMRQEYIDRYTQAIGGNLNTYQTINEANKLGINENTVNRKFKVASDKLLNYTKSSSSKVRNLATQLRTEYGTTVSVENALNLVKALNTLKTMENGR